MKWIVAAGVLLIAAVLLIWKLTAPSERRAQPARVIDAGVATAPPVDAPPLRGTRIVKTPGKPVDAGPAAKEEKLDPKSEAFSRVLDVGIPDTLRAYAADCYKGGDDPDRKMKILYKLRIQNGAVWVTDVRADNTEIDEKTAKCMVDAVEKANWRGDNLPDHTEEGELFIRLRALKKYKYRDFKRQN